MAQRSRRGLHAPQTVRNPCIDSVRRAARLSPVPKSPHGSQRKYKLYNCRLRGEVEYEENAAVVVGVVCCCFGLTVAQDKARLLNVKRIYVGALGKEEGSDMNREKIRLLLMKAERFTVVERPQAPTRLSQARRVLTVPLPGQEYYDSWIRKRKRPSGYSSAAVAS